MRLTILACWMVCGVFAGRTTAADRPSVKDEATGVAVQVKADNRTVVVTDKDGKALWEVDVIQSAGPPVIGQPMVRHLSLKDGKVRAIYGKNSYADFDLTTGKLLASGSE